MGIQWDTAWAGHVLVDISTNLHLKVTGVHRSLNPLDLSDEPEIAAIVEAVDLGMI